MKYIIILLSVMLMLLSCGGEDSDDDTTPENFEQYTKELSTAMCNKMFNCEEAGDAESFYGSFDACVESFMVRFESSACKAINETALNDCVSCTNDTPCSEYYANDDFNSCDEYCNDSLCIN